MKNLKDQLNNELDAIVPSMSERIKRQPIVTVPPAEGTDDSFVKAETERKRKFSRRSFGRYTAAFSAAAALMICVLLCVFLLPSALPQETYGTLVLEINPAVNFVFGEENKVNKISALNQDADILLSDDTFYASLMNISVEDAVEKFTRRAEQAGYVKDGQTVNISVLTNNERKTEELLLSLTEQWGDCFSDSLETCTLKSVKSDVGTFCERLGVERVTDFDLLLDEIDALPTYTFEAGIDDLEPSEIQELYEVAATHGVYKDLVMSLLQDAYDKAALLDAMSVLNEEIMKDDNNPALFFGDYWTVTQIYKNTGMDSEFSEKLARMTTLLAEYEERYSEKIESYTDLLLKTVSYGVLSEIVDTVEDWLEYISDDAFDLNGSYILSLLPSDYQPFVESLQAVRESDAPETAEEYVARMKELYRLYAVYLGAAE